MGSRHSTCALQGMKLSVKCERSMVIEATGTELGHELKQISLKKVVLGLTAVIMHVGTSIHCCVASHERSFIAGIAWPLPSPRQFESSSIYISLIMVARFLFWGVFFWCDGRCQVAPRHSDEAWMSVIKGQSS